MNWLLFYLSIIIPISLSNNEFPITSPPPLNKCIYNELGKMTSISIPGGLMGNNETTSFSLQKQCSKHCTYCPPSLNRRTKITIPSVFSRSSPYHFSPTGFLRQGRDFFSPDDYCILAKHRHTLTVEICTPSCPTTHICVPKCCAADKVLDFKSNSCKPTKTLWTPLVYQNDSLLQLCGNQKTNIRFHFQQQRMPPCLTQEFYLKPMPGDKFRVKFRLLTDGELVMKELQDSDWTRPEKGTYCLDGAQNFNEDNEGDYDGDPLDQVLIVCAEEDFGNRSGGSGGGGKCNEMVEFVPLTGILYSILLFSGVPFLLLTSIIYILIWPRQNVHGKTLFSHTLAMLLHYVGQGVTNMVSRVYNTQDNASFSCVAIAIGNHYFALASFCWMTMINYDLWKTFRRLKNTQGRSKGHRRFLLYTLFGWGLPFLVVSISVLLDMEYGLYADVEDSICSTELIVPLYGHKSCYISEESLPIYLYYPIAFLMFINVLFATLTFWNMMRHKESTSRVIGDRKNVNKHEQRFSMWFKLFVVMGIALTSEVIVWLMKEKCETLPWYLVFPDILSLLQAIAIFLLFSCQAKILGQLREECPGLGGLIDWVLSLPCYHEGGRGVGSR